MAFEWFRSWHGAPTDTKFLLIGRRAKVAAGIVSAVYWALLDHASQNKPRGSIKGFDAESYAEWSGWEPGQIDAVINAMRDKGMIDPDGRLASWDKRQPKRERADDAPSTERVRRFRKNKKAIAQNDVTGDVTPSNATKRHETQCNGLDKIRIDESVNDENRVPGPAPAAETDAIHSPDFQAVERSFQINLLNAVKERDPRQSMAGGFSLSDSSRAALVQVVNGGPVLTAKAIDWALDQWEAAKPNQTFRVADTGCVNWLLATINNSYRPAGKTNGLPPGASAPLKTAGRAAQEASNRTAAGVAALRSQGVTEDDPLYYPKLNAWIEDTYGK